MHIRPSGQLLSAGRHLASPHGGWKQGAQLAELPSDRLLYPRSTQGLFCLSAAATTAQLQQSIRGRGRASRPCSSVLVPHKLLGGPPPRTAACRATAHPRPTCMGARGRGWDRWLKATRVLWLSSPSSHHPALHSFRNSKE